MHLKPFISTRAISVIGSSLLGLVLLVTFITSAQKPGFRKHASTPVFYPKRIGDDCKTKISLLKAGKLEIDGNFIGLSPDWTLGTYNLHSLRFVDCLVLEGQQGNIQSFNLAKKIILDWDKKNMFAKKIESWTWEDNKGAWSEHGVSWRAILLSYFYQVVQKLSPEDHKLIKHLQEIAKAHGDFLSSSRVYMSDHNHGLNNAMGLLALGTTFQELPDAHKWVDLSLARAEQQMHDNVSSDGVHLEHSGFYHFYTLRTFMEIYEVAQALGRPLSDEYCQKLDKMLEVGALMAGSNRRVEGIPWNNHELDVVGYLKNVAALELGTSTRGQELFQQVKQGYSARGLFIKPEGGFSFFTGRFGKELEINFHTRILSAPHAQADALGLTAMVGNQRILTYGNYRSAAHEPKDFNTVQITGLKQGSTLKINRKSSLRKRLIPNGGEVLTSASLPELDFVTARNQAYAGVTHTRTVARIGTHYLLVWDRLEADTEHEYTQTFHFAIPLKIGSHKKEGFARLQEKPIVHFRQLEQGTEVSICDVGSESNLCSWEHDRAGKLIPTPEVSYRSVGKTVEFLWVLYAGAGSFASQVKTVSTSKPQVKIVTLSGEGGNYRVHLQGLKLSLE